MGGLPGAAVGAVGAAAGTAAAAAAARCGPGTMWDEGEPQHRHGS